MEDAWKMREGAGALSDVAETRGGEVLGVLPGFVLQAVRPESSARDVVCLLSGAALLELPGRG